MIFEWFRRKKKVKSLSELIADSHLYRDVIGRFERLRSLNKLGRSAEAIQEMRETVKLVNENVAKNPGDKRAHFLKAYFYLYVGDEEKAESALVNLLSSDAFQLTDEERLITAGELQNLKRQKHLEARDQDGPHGFTQIYCCGNCGRLHNFLSMPCPHCDWFPSTDSDAAQSIILSNAHLTIPQLLALSREIGAGRSADDVIPNLKQDAVAYLGGEEQRRAVHEVLSLLNQNRQKTQRSIKEVLGCPACGSRIHFSGSLHCGECGEEVRWPHFLRSLACIDSLLWLLETRVEPDSSGEFSDFVCGGFNP